MRCLPWILLCLATAACGGRSAAPASPLPAAPSPSASCGPATAEDFYLPPALPPQSAANRGTILRCERLGHENSSELELNYGWRASVASGTEPTSGLLHYRILYLSEGPAGTPAVVSATAYLPTPPRDGHCVAGTRAPIVAVQHATTGTADKCAPS